MLHIARKYSWGARLDEQRRAVGAADRVAWGRLFFAYFLLAKQKKVRRASSAKNNRRKSPKPKNRGLSPVWTV